MADVVAGTRAFSDRYHFLVRRLHSLSGIIPVGVFLCIHLSINASIMAGPRAFQFAVERIHMLDSLGILKAVEVLFIFIPIAFHAFVGILIWLSGKSNVTTYQYVGNLRYTLQRWTGIIALFFIVAHLWHIHWIIPGGHEFDAHAAAQSTILAMQDGWAAPVYALGMLCAVFHLANGIWTFLIVWGITIGPRSQTISGCVCAVIGIVLAIFGTGSLITLKSMDATDAAHGAGGGSHTAITVDAADAFG